MLPVLLTLPLAVAAAAPVRSPARAAAPAPFTEADVRPLLDGPLAEGQRAFAESRWEEAVRRLAAYFQNLEWDREGDGMLGGGPFVTGPDGQTESGALLMVNRNKRGIAVDLKSDQARRAFHRLVARAVEV